MVPVTTIQFSKLNEFLHQSWRVVTRCFLQGWVNGFQATGIGSEAKFQSKLLYHSFNEVYDVYTILYYTIHIYIDS